MTHSILIIAVSALTTMAIRFFPFLVFGKRKVPEIVQYLGRVLPCAIMATLVVYCLKGVTLFSGNHGLPELIARDGTKRPREPLLQLSIDLGHPMCRIGRRLRSGSASFLPHSRQRRIVSIRMPYAPSR